MTNNGTVKLFDTQKGFGFIPPEQGSKDIFVPMAALDRAGISQLDNAESATFDIKCGQDGRESSTNLALA